MVYGFGRFLRRNTIALLALFLALGGTTWAASSALIGRNTVASPQVVNGSLQTKDLSAKARKALKGNRGLRGLRGLQGAKGATGAQGVQGVQGPAGPFPDSLASGKTLRGAWSLGSDQAASAGSYDNSTISFLYKLATAPTVVKIPVGGPNPDATHCTGTVVAPEAAGGYLCIYVGISTNATNATPTTFGSPFLAPTSGLELENFATADGTWLQIGSWAVTAA
jgi:hypothetical protein